MRLPGIVQDIADVIGRERALYLIGQLPTCAVRDSRGASWVRHRPILYVPTLRRLAPDHQLVRIIGWNAAEKLCRHFGGEILHPANCADIYRQFRDRSIVRLVSEGVPPRVVAEWFGITDRHVRSLRREIPQEEFRCANDNNSSINTDTAA